MFAGVYAGKRCRYNDATRLYASVSFAPKSHERSILNFSTTFLGQGSQNGAAPEEERETGEGEGGGEGEGEVVEDQGSGSPFCCRFLHFLFFRLAFEDIEYI